MKYSVIEDIYYGNRGQGQQVKPSEEYKRLNKECLEFYDSLMATLNDEQKQKLDELLDREMGITAETAVNYYKEGLKIGLLMFAECLQD